MTDAAACNQGSDWWSSFKSWLPFSNNFDRCDNNGKYCSLQVEIDSSMAQVFWLKNLPCSAIIPVNHSWNKMKLDYMHIQNAAVPN